MKKVNPPTRRQLLHLLCGIAGLPLLTSCGTIIYPDRVNQEKRGNLDPLVIILDGVGLFFFVIPGIIAFAVDFTTGAIYLPEGKESGETKERTIFNDLSMHTHPGGKLRQEDIERTLTAQTGRPVRLDEGNVRVWELKSLSQVPMHYQQIA